MSIVTTHVASEENFVLCLVQNRNNDNRVSPWVSDVMQSFPGNKQGYITGDTKMKGTKLG